MRQDKIDFSSRLVNVEKEIMGPRDPTERQIKEPNERIEEEPILFLN